MIRPGMLGAALVVTGALLAPSAAAATSADDAAADPSAATVTVSGRITDANTGEPLDHACVLTAAPDEPWGFSYQTCLLTDGRYEFEAPVGEYLVQFEEDGYAPQWWDHASSSLEATVLKATRGVDLTDVDAALVEPATMTGRAVDSVTGEVIRDSCPRLWFGRSDHGANGYYDRCSNRDGYWTVTALPPTEVTLEMSTPGNRDNWLWAYGVEDQADATLLELQAGEALDVGDVPVEKLGVIRGKVLDAKTGEPLANKTVAINGYSPRSGECEYCASTNKRGRFELRGITPGRYALAAFEGYPDFTYAVQWLGGAATEAEGERIKVEADETARARFRLHKSATVTGTLPDLEDYLQVDAYSSDYVELGVTTQLGFSSDVSPATGRFTIRGLPATTVLLCFNFCSDDPEQTEEFFYDGVRDPDDATLIKLKPGKTVDVRAHYPPDW